MPAEKPAWQEIDALFKRNGYQPPPSSLRDELVAHLVAYREQRKSGFGPFDGYAVLNTARKGLVFDQGGESAFVWDDRAEAESHMRVPISKGTSTCMGKKEVIYIVGSWSGPAMWLDCRTKEQAQERAAKAYEGWINLPAQESIRAKAGVALRGKNLACWCKPGTPCHADVLLEIANR